MWTGNASRRPGEDPGTSKLEHVMMVAESPDPSSQVAAGRAAEHEAGPVIGAMGTDRRAGPARLADPLCDIFAYGVIY